MEEQLTTLIHKFYGNDVYSYILANPTSFCVYRKYYFIPDREIRIEASISPNQIEVKFTKRDQMKSFVLSSYTLSHSALVYAYIIEADRFVNSKNIIII